MLFFLYFIFINVRLVPKKGISRDPSYFLIKEGKQLKEKILYGMHHSVGAFLRSMHVVA